MEGEGSPRTCPTELPYRHSGICARTIGRPPIITFRARRHIRSLRSSPSPNATGCAPDHYISGSFFHGQPPIRRCEAKRGILPVISAAFWEIEPSVHERTFQVSPPLDLGSPSQPGPSRLSVGVACPAGARADKAGPACHRCRMAVLPGPSPIPRLTPVALGAYQWVAACGFPQGGLDRPIHRPADGGKGLPPNGWAPSPTLYAPLRPSAHSAATKWRRVRSTSGARRHFIFIV